MGVVILIIYHTEIAADSGGNILELSVTAS